MGIIIDILKEIPLSAVLKEQLLIQEKKMSALESDNRKLKTENKELKEKINNLKKLSNNISLNEIEKNILIILEKQTTDDRITVENIAHSLKANETNIAYHLEELATKKIIMKNHFPGNNDWIRPAYDYWKLAQDGRRYLIENKLIKT